MGEFKPLYVGTEGYVVRCPEQDYLQCAFGCTVLTLHEEDFRTLMQVAGAQLEEAQAETAEELKQYWLPTAHPGVNMLLTLQELRQFYRMLQAADTELAVSALVALFQDA
jgi:hypothetical protein